MTQFLNGVLEGSLEEATSWEFSLYQKCRDPVYPDTPLDMKPSLADH